MSKTKASVFGRCGLSSAWFSRQRPGARRRGAKPPLQRAPVKPSPRRRSPRPAVLAAKVTTVYVTHDPEEAMSLAERVVVMEGGRIRQIGTPAEVYAHAADLFVA